MPDNRCPACGAARPPTATGCPACRQAAATLPPPDPVLPAPPAGRPAATRTAPPPAPAPTAALPPDNAWAGPAADTEPVAVGRFEVRARLGSGAFGDVYRAYDPQLDRDVALKVARAGALDGPQVRRFVREAKAAAGLRHPNIAPVYEAGQAGGRQYIAAGLVDGRTLEVELAAAGGRFAPERAAAVARKLADALAYAHSQGVVHRDVKPANVLVDPAGDPHLVDFGLAARAAVDDGLKTVAGGVLGTPAYMAPEQAAGMGDAVGPAADQYALGVVLYELLTGRRPFDGPVHLLLALHQTADPPRPRGHHRDVPRELEAVVLRCLEKDTRRRYRSCADLAEDLRRFQAGERWRRGR